MSVIQQAREALPALARDNHSRGSIRDALLGAFPTLAETLGPQLLDKWIWDTLRRHKDGEQLPLFGAFGKSLSGRESWGDAEYVAYWSRYDSASASNAALRDRLAAEYEQKFGKPLQPPGQADEDR